jgi:hypothetical protein
MKCGTNIENFSVSHAWSPSNWRNILLFTWRICMVNWRVLSNATFVTRCQRIRRVWGNIWHTCMPGAEIARWKMLLLKFHLITLSRGRLNVLKHVHSPMEALYLSSNVANRRILNRFFCHTSYQSSYSRALTWLFQGNNTELCILLIFMYLW